MTSRKRFDHTRFKNWRFLQLSIFLILLVFIAPYLSQAWITKIIFNFIFLNSVLVVFSTDSRIVHHKKNIFILWGISAFFSMLSFIYAASKYFIIYETLDVLSSTVLLSMLIYCILYFIFREKEITIDSIFAVLSVYLIIAIMFALFYSFIFAVEPGSFHFSTEKNFPPSNSGINSNMFYFSMVTLATLGYGDIVAVSHFARNVSVVEALIGQFFVAVIVATLVGKLIINFENAKR
jgi:voltage-gated potassium channel